MKNTSELRTEMIEVFKDLKNRKIDTKSAKTMVMVSNCILKSASIEADYNKFLGKKNEIDFLQTGGKKA